MPLNQGQAPGHAFANTNGSLRKEIKNDLLDKINDIADLKRVSDSIATSNNFHLDSRLLQDQNYKVDVQYKQGKKETVAQIFLHPNATSLDDAKDGINNSANDGHIWIVT